MSIIFPLVRISFYSIYHYATWQQRTEDDLFGQTVVDCFATLPVGIIGALTQAFLAARASTVSSREAARTLCQRTNPLLTT